MTYKILVVDDDPMITNLIKTYLEREHYHVIVANNGRSALELARQRQPDLIVLDIMLPKVEGLDVCRILRRESDVHIIMLTAKTTEDDVLLGLDLGADDYMTKPFSPRELVARIRTVLRRHQNLNRSAASSKVIRVGNLVIDLLQHEVSLHQEKIYLTPREFKILETLAETPGRVFSRLELLDIVFGLESDSLERTVDYHIMNLRRKIEPDPSQSSYIQTVFGVGYKFTTETDFS